jgi:hypothetical protein
MKEKKNKSKLVKLRVTPEEHVQLLDLARDEGGLSALIRKRIFGRHSSRPPVRTDVVLLGRIHSCLQTIARALPDRADPFNALQVLVQLQTIEHHIAQLLTRLNS